jgi:curved DNA-binding protein
MEFKDYYKIMGVTKDASAEEIKKTYRKLARKYHPDVSKEAGAETKFKDVNEAYDVLKDPEKRKAYDQMGSQWQGGQQFNPNDFDFNQFKDYQGFQGNSMGGGGEEFGDFFEHLFGGRQRTKRSRAVNGENAHVTMHIGLEDAFSGTTKTIHFTLNEPGADGQMHQVPKTLKIKIPAGVMEGQQIRLTGQGSKGINGGQVGDLYIKIHLKPHQLFHIENRDIYLTVPITPWEAGLGASIDVPTLAGNVNVKIPAGTRSGQKLRLKDKGLKGKTETGSQFLELQIQAPKAETDEQKQLYQKMQELFNFNPRATWKGDVS